MEQTYFDEFILEAKAKLLAKTTVRMYIDNIRPLYDMFPDKKCSDITVTDMREWIIYKSEKWSKQTMKKAIVIIKVFYNWLKERGYIDVNVMKNVQIPKTGSTPIPFITQGEMDKIVARADDITTPLLARLLFWLIIETGLRGKEVLSLERSNINLKEHLIYIRNSKGKVSKLVAFSRKTEKLLRQWMASTNPNSHPKYVFSTKRGKEMPHSYIYTTISENIFWKTFGWKWDKKSGPHMLRHIAATRWVARGGNLEGLRLMMGWKDYTQVRRYVHSSPTMIKEMFYEVNGGKRGRKRKKEII